MSMINVLIVEDSPTDSLLVKEYLAEDPENDFNCIEAASLRDALKVLSHFDIDVVLLDLQLPDSSGLDTVRKIVSNTPGMAVIVLTGLQDKELALKTIRYGAQDFLEKQSLSSTTLKTSIRHSIDKSKYLQEKEDLLHDLDTALFRIEQLEGFLPLCMGCKKILADNNQWYALENCNRQIKTYDTEELVCPDCRTNLN